MIDRKRLARGASVLAMALGCLAAPPAFAQTSPAPAPPPAPGPAPAPAPAPASEVPTADAAAPDGTTPPAVEGSRTFTPADFARYAPRNALDMISRVPGFAIRDAVQERGLGQATGNVLLNGQRIADKSVDIGTQLSRIPAANVVRIEIVDGASLDLPGLSGQVANIITRSTSRMSGQFAWRPDFRARNTDPQLTRFETSVTGQRGPIQYTLGLENQASHSGANGLTLIRNADGTLREYRDDQWTGEFNQPRASLRLVLDGPGTSVGNLNASYREFWYDYFEDGFRTGPGLVDRNRDVTVEENGHNWEIGGDFEFALGPGRLKLIGLNRWSHSVPDTLVLTEFADGRPNVGDRFARDATTQERIGRAEYRWSGGGAEWQLSGEAAFNSLDNVSSYFQLNSAGDFVEIPLPGGTARVEEDRYEVMASYGRALSPAFRFQLALGGEYSQLSQVGGGGLTRSFWRPKGTLTAAWKPDEDTDVNMRLQRRVGQLNFFDFLASVDVQDDQENAGNPNLVPPQIWEAEVEVARRMGAHGSLTFRAYGHVIDDLVDTIPIGATGESPGNIDRAYRYGAELRGTINLDPVGLRGVRLDGRALLQNSHVRDPLTGEDRRISNSLMHLAELNLRHDVPETDWAWGTGFSYSYAAPDVRLTEIGRQWEGPVWTSIFIEHKDVFGLTVRATMTNFLGADSMWQRTVYAGRRTGPVAFYEDRDRLIGPIFSFQIRGRF